MAPVVLLILGIFVILLATGFMVIARKGRALRKSQPLPPQTSSGFLETSLGIRHRVEQNSYFYIGKSASSDIVLPAAKQEYEVCIFYHRRRFAFQTPSGIPNVRVNGEEQLAGYLFDGDVLTVAGETFTFRTEQS